MTTPQLITILSPIAAKFITDLVRNFLLSKELSRTQTQLLAIAIGAASSVLAALATSADLSATQIAACGLLTLTVNELGKTIRDRASSTVNDALPLLLLALLLATTACASFERNSYRTLAITGSTATQAMHAWRDWVNAGHATPDQVATVKLAYLQYQAAYNVAVDALALYVQTKEQGPYTAAKAQLDTALIDVLHLIETYHPKQVTP